MDEYIRVPRKQWELMQYASMGRRQSQPDPSSCIHEDSSKPYSTRIPPALQQYDAYIPAPFQEDDPDTIYSTNPQPTSLHDMHQEYFESHIDSEGQFQPNFPSRSPEYDDDNQNYEDINQGTYVCKCGKQKRPLFVPPSTKRTPIPIVAPVLATNEASSKTPCRKSSARPTSGDNHTISTYEETSTHTSIDGTITTTHEKTTRERTTSTKPSTNAFADISGEEKPESALTPNVVAEINAIIMTVEARQTTFTLADIAAGLLLPADQKHYRIANASPGSKRVTSYCFLSGQDPRRVLERYSQMLSSNPEILVRLKAAVYSRNLKFTGSASSIMAWLHDNISHIHLLRRLECTYHYGSDQSEQHTCPLAFKKLLNDCVHKIPALEHASFIISDKFWTAASWQKGVEEVFNHVDLMTWFPYAAKCATPHRNFLQHIARLAPGVMVNVKIEGTDTGSKREFVRDLNWKIRIEQILRPDVYRRPIKVEPFCKCSEKGRKSPFLEDTCCWVHNEAVPVLCCV